MGISWLTVAQGEHKTKMGWEAGPMDPSTQSGYTGILHSVLQVFPKSQPILQLKVYSKKGRYMT